jgi:hypothetical protein
MIRVFIHYEVDEKGVSKNDLTLLSVPKLALRDRSRNQGAEFDEFAKDRKTGGR